MRTLKFFSLALVGSFLLVACSNDDDGGDSTDIPQGEYDNGFFVLNEGSAGDGSVTYASEDVQIVTQNIFQQANEGETIGKFAQSIFFDDDLAYIIANGSNLISVVNRYTFELEGTIDSGLNIPRYGVAEDGKAYVTNQADFSTGTDDYVAVINLETFEVENTIEVGDYVEYIEEEDGKLYVQNATYGMGNKISVINPETRQVEEVVEVNDGLNAITLEDDILYALSATKLEKIAIPSLEPIEELSFEYLDDEDEIIPARFIEVENNTTYYTVGNAVYAAENSATTAPETPLIDFDGTSIYGFAVEDDKIYLADSGDFSSESEANIYSINGDLIQEIAVGVAPNGFYFND